jgi:hypothetical protein
LKFCYNREHWKNVVKNVGQRLPKLKRVPSPKGGYVASISNAMSMVDVSQEELDVA